MSKNKHPGTQITRASVTYSGPIPPSAELGRYETLIPGAAERILAMAEKQAQHVIDTNQMTQELQRREQEIQKQQQDHNEKALHLVAKDNARSQYLAFIAVMTGFCFAGYLIHRGQSLIGIGLFLTELAGVGYLFVQHTKSQNQS